MISYSICRDLKWLFQTLQIEVHTFSPSYELKLLWY